MQNFSLIEERINQLDEIFYYLKEVKPTLEAYGNRRFTRSIKRT